MVVTTVYSIIHSFWKIFATSAQHHHYLSPTCDRVRSKFSSSSDKNSN